MIHGLLDTAAAVFPDHAAIVHNGRVTTYRDLAACARGVCGHLLEAGLRKGDRVIVLWDNSVEYSALFFGILMAGGVAVPLNPTNTKESVRYVASHCGAAHVAANTRAIALLEDWWTGSTPVTDSSRTRNSVTLESIVEKGWRGGEDFSGDSKDLAMVLYTSGTTGKPKGVMLTHRNLEANTRSVLDYLHLCPSDRTLAILPFYYSYGNSMLLTHVASGAALVVENGFAFVNRALETMREEEVTGFSGVPSHFSILIHRSKFLGSAWPTIRYMTCAGGGLAPAHVRKIRESLPHVELHLMYGQTEGAARLSSLAPSLVDVKIGSVGKGIPGVELRVVEKDGSDAGPGAVGEIVARGENIMAGYLGDPEGTREVVRNGWLHTGDLATVDEEGFIYIKGRAKEFIKSGGYRISPQQIEETLLQHPAVTDCVAVGVPDEILGEAVVAYVVFKPDAGTGDDAESVLTYSRSKLPHYMVPARVVTTPSIPKTESGKVQRYLLRDMAARRV